MEKDIQCTKELYHKMVDEVEDYAIILLDKNGDILNWNKGAEKIKGYKAEEIVGKNFKLFYTPEDQTNGRPQVLLDIAAKQGKAIDENWRCKKDGSRFWGSVTITSLHGANGSVIGFTKVTRDLTERYQAERKLQAINEELRRSQQLYHKMVDEVEDYAIILLDKNGNILNWNKGAEKIKGYRAEEIVDKSFKLFYTPEDQLKGHPEELLGIAIREGKAAEESWRRKKDGSRFWGSITITALHDDNGNIIGFSKVTRDLTERHETEQKLKRSESLFRSIVLNIPGSLIVLVDREHKIVMAEGEIKKKSRLKEQDDKENLVVELLEEEHPALKSFYERTLNGEKFSLEKNTGYGDVLVHFIPLNDALDYVEFCLIIVLNVTKIKEAERKIFQLNRDLELKVKERTAQYQELNKELEAFAYSVSHDLRAPLRSINGFSRILLEDHADKLDDHGLKTINNLIRNAGKMAALIDDLLDFSRLGKRSLNITKINMDDLVHSIIDDSYSESNKQRINFSINELLPATGDYSLLKQVWINLISNAVKYSGTKSVAEIEIGSQANGNSITYYIKDNGVGFDMDYYDKLFGVFQRLHSETEFPGTGVGLAIVHKIIKHHGGKVWAEGKTQEGATFFFTLKKPTTLPRQNPL